MSKSEPLYSAIGKAGVLYDIILQVSGYTKAMQRFVRALINESGEPVETVLDAGCGTGHYALAVLRQLPGSHVTAFDLQDTMVKRAKQNIAQGGFQDRATFLVADISQPLSFAPHSFDAIIISGVLEYAPTHETVANIAQYLRPGGYILHSPVQDSWYGRIIGKLYHFTPKPRQDFIRAFTSQGFTLKRVIELPRIHPGSFKEAHIFQKA